MLFMLRNRIIVHIIQGNLSCMPKIGQLYQQFGYYDNLFLTISYIYEEKVLEACDH